MSDLVERLERIKALKIGKGFQFLLNEAYKILGNPLVLFNMEFQLLAHTEDIVTDDPIWNEIITTGTFYSETTAFFRDEGFTNAVANMKKTVILISDNLKYDRICGRIFNKSNSTVADLVMVACYRPLEDDDNTVFEAVCEKLGREVGRNDFFQNYGILYHEFWIRKLIDKNVLSKSISYGHISNIYEGLKTNLYLAVADISKCDKYDELAAFRDLFKKAQPEFKYAIYSDYIVIIISTDNETIDVKKDLRKLSKLYKQNNIYVGVSSCFDNLFELHKYYDEAVNALTVGFESSNNQQIFLYDEITNTPVSEY